MTNLSDYIELRSLVDVLYDIQDVRMRTDNRLRQMPRETAQLKAKQLKKLEDQLTKEIDVILQDIPIYTTFLRKVRGVGPRISGSIIAQTMIRFEKITEEEYKELEKQYTNDAHNADMSQEKSDTHLNTTYSLEQYQLAQKTENGGYLIPTRRGIEAFDTCSKYWAWWGLHVVNGHAAKRRKGETINWNPKMRTLAWKIGKQFVMQGQGYRQIYDMEKDRLSAQRLPIGKCNKYEACKAKLKNRTEPTCKGHINAMARRKAVKLFLSHLYECWRGLEELPTRPPYVLEKMEGHSTKSTWQDLPDLDE